MSELIFYDVLEQTKYQITVCKPAALEDLSDMFISSEELRDLTGQGNSHNYLGEGQTRKLCLKSSVTAEINKLIAKLETSGKKSIPIEDEDLLDVLKGGYLSDFIDDDTTFGRHGDRLGYKKRYARKKHKATQGDVRNLWDALSNGFYDKYKTWPTHIPKYDRHIRMFKAFKKIVGWRLVRSRTDKEQAKFYRQIWDNPEEYIR